MKDIKESIGSVLGAGSKNKNVIITPANLLTLLRLALVPAFIYCFLFSGKLSLEITSSFLFITAAITDLIDGKLARRRGEITQFGNFMDPLADKLLVFAGFWAIWVRADFDRFVTLALIWIILITIREIGLTVMRIMAISGGSSLVTSGWGKLKTTVQLTTLIFTLLALNVRDILLFYQIDTPIFKGAGFFILINVLFFLSALTSLISGGFYLKGALKKGETD
ncbi:MAG: CDP-alcohol phosphatidyltransferase family protein [Calditrichaeota bacterium]|nr:CDP-alcohol phosphatidyltransferase family protein [Calditrichota bacterium]